VKGTSSDGNDVYSINGGATLTPSDGNSGLDTYNLVKGGPHPSAYVGFGYSNQTVSGTYDWCCNDDQWVYGDPISWPIEWWFMTPDILSGQVSSQTQGNVLDGTYTSSYGNITYHWHFEAIGP